MGLVPVPAASCEPAMCADTKTAEGLASRSTSASPCTPCKAPKSIAEYKSTFDERHDQRPSRETRSTILIFEREVIDNNEKLVLLVEKHQRLSVHPLPEIHDLISQRVFIDKF